jgi:hypothetical protein
MKKIFMILLCVLMIVAVPTVAFAEDTVTEETTTEVEMTITERVVEYVKENAEGILTVIASIGSAILVKLISGKLSTYVSTLNNNSITIAKEAEDKLGVASKKLEEYAEKMTEVLLKYEKSEDEKKALEGMLNKVTTLLETSKIAVVELGNEFAELILLANIPNAKKESFYASHKEAMQKLEKAEGVISNDKTKE